MTMPATLRYRDVAVRSITAACQLIGLADEERLAGDATALDLRRGFDSEFISAFSEIFNNIAIHAYERKSEGNVELEICPERDHLTLLIRDSGKSFDIDAVPTPELESLPEGGMGIHIARACLDDLSYTAGPPNVWRLTKYLSQPPKDGDA